MFRVTKKEEIFFDLFIQAADLACVAAKKLDDLINHYENIEEKIDAIEEVEHECDKIVHTVMKQLNKSFITPLDREDIVQISMVLDDIVDAIEAVAHRFKMFNVQAVTEYAAVSSKLIVQSTTELRILICEFKHMKTSKIMDKQIIDVNSLENEGDRVFRKAMTSLFANGIDAVEVIKWKEIYEHLEDTLDACEEVANIVEGVVTKNA